jgi:hypothetical protein
MGIYIQSSDLPRFKFDPLAFNFIIITIFFKFFISIVCHEITKQKISERLFIRDHVSRFSLMYSLC